MLTPAVVPAQLGRYRILKPLGQGGMGAVFLAEDTELGRKVALKVPHANAQQNPEVIARFKREARLAAQIDHPAICAVFDVGEQHGISYFVMPYIEGTPLSHSTGPDRPWEPQHALALVSSVALVVQVLHDKGLIHRDLKPSNIMLRPSGEPVLMDLGLARSFVAHSQQLTSTGAILGTPAYMSPEQVRGEKTIGSATDVYSLGAILYELLTGQVPFPAGNSWQLIYRIMEQPPAPPSTLQPHLDRALDELCLKALAKHPQDRPASAAAFAEELAAPLHQHAAAPTSPARPAPPAAVAILETVPPSSARMQTTPEWTGGHRRWKPLLGGVILGAAALAGVITLALLNHNADRQKSDGAGSFAEVPNTSPRQATAPTPRATGPAKPADNGMRDLDKRIDVIAEIEKWREAERRELKDSTIVLKAPDPVEVEAGTNASLGVSLRRVKFEGSVNLRLENLPRGVQAVEGVLKDEKETGEVTLRVAADAKPGTTTARLTATYFRGTRELLRATQEVRITIRAALAKSIENSIKMKLVLIPAGKFKMGSPTGEEGRHDNEHQHIVEITKPFHMGLHEVTQAQFEKVMGYNPSYFAANAKGKEGTTYPHSFSKPGGGKEQVKNLGSTGDFPVENVSWEEANEFCKKLTKLEEKKGTGLVYRLPTEAEWEYACRGGAASSDPYHFGKTLSSTQANFNYNVGRPTPVGYFKKPNDFGLHDMHGNVREWCADYFDKDHYKTRPDPDKDPPGPKTETKFRVLRGGSWSIDGSCRSALRYWLGPGFRGYHLGFRVVCSPAPRTP